MKNMGRKKIVEVLGEVIHSKRKVKSERNFYQVPAVFYESGVVCRDDLLTLLQRYIDVSCSQQSKPCIQFPLEAYWRDFHERRCCCGKRARCYSTEPATTRTPKVRAPLLTATFYQLSFTSICISSNSYSDHSPSALTNNRWEITARSCSVQ